MSLAKKWNRWPKKGWMSQMAMRRDEVRCQVRRELRAIAKRKGMKRRRMTGTNTHKLRMIWLVEFWSRQVQVRYKIKAHIFTSFPFPNPPPSTSTYYELFAWTLFFYTTTAHLITLHFILLVLLLYIKSIYIHTSLLRLH